MTNAYLKDEAATARAFRGGWFYPGDIGALDGAGFLTLAGRVDHLLNVGGDKIDPYEIEAVLNTHPAITESAVVAVPNESGNLVAVAAVVASGAYDDEELKRMCRERLGQRCVPKRVVTLPALPKNAGGKIMRAQLTATIERPPAGEKSGASAPAKPQSRTAKAKKTS
jgi:acyl-coenzyme A synthetase/AMP-(fatty) acid ligase